MNNTNPENSEKSNICFLLIIVMPQNYNYFSFPPIKSDKNHY
ncbi:hypothetical protein TASCI_60030 [Tenacibaculum ascidiaceicola]